MNTANSSHSWEIEMPADRNSASYTVHLGGSFFEAAAHADLLSGDVQAQIRLTPAGDLWRIDLEVKGRVQTLCDRCQSPMTACVDDSYSAPLCPSPSGVVPVGDDSDAVYYDPATGVADLLRPLTDTIALSLGLRHTHEPGCCDPVVEALLDSDTSEANTPMRAALEALAAQSDEDGGNGSEQRCRDKHSPQK